MQVGMTKDQGLYNKPSAAVHPGAGPCHNTIQYNHPILLGSGCLLYVVIVR